MKAVTLIIETRVDKVSGNAVIDHVAYSRKYMRKVTLTALLFGTHEDANVRRDAYKRFRNGWRNAVLKPGWRERGVFRREAIKNAEFNKRYRGMHSNVLR